VRLWENIRKAWESFSSFSRLVVGDGTRIRSWHDLWCGDMGLKDASIVVNVELLGGSI
jgi:hypothetical protein